ncbi:hypothetical protein HQ585_00050 [candidate division KSB1 bacterium]|nr:hypothetical protein [candidate division KSB1 bacterium]
MTRKNVKKGKSSRSSTKRQKGQQDQTFWSIFAFLVFILLVFYLGGKVHIEYVLRETGALGENKTVLERRTADLRVQVNALQSYDRIVAKAQEQGLVFVRHNDIADLHVDLEGIENLQNPSKSKLQLARIIPF